MGAAGTTRPAEAERLACLRRYDVLDTPPDASFDHITALVASVLQVPIAIVSLVDADRIWFKSRHGIAVEQVPRDPGLCASAILFNEPWIVDDASTDPRTLANPLVAGAMGLRFYAAVPLQTKDGFNLGTLCVIDRQPRSLDPSQTKFLTAMAGIVMDAMELRLEARRAVRAELEMREKAWAAQAQWHAAVSNRRRQFALDAAEIGDWELDLSSGTVIRSLRHDQCFGYDAPQAEWTYAIFLAHVHPEDRARVDRAFRTAVAAGALYEVEFRVHWPDGSLHWLLSRGHVSRRPDGSPVSVAGIQIDITARKLAQAHTDHLAMVVDRITTPVMTTDTSGNIDWVNDAFLQMTGYAPDEVLGQHPGRLLQGHDSDPVSIRIMHDAIQARRGFEVDILNYRKDGAPFWQHIKADPIASDVAPGAAYIAVQSDITERKMLESELWTKANFDGLTLLPNRRLFWDRLDNALHHARRTDTVVAVLFVDLDRFKEVNDLHGHEHGDAVLQEMATRIRTCLRASDTAARMGGDEFAIILGDLTDVLKVDHVARKLLDILSAPVMMQAAQCTLSASVGVALFPADADDAEHLFRHADQAMYLAKNSGRNRLVYFTPLMQERSERRLRIGHDLRHAMARCELAVHFQPIVDLRTDRIVKAEALLRWQHPDHGAIEPAEFIPLAEELGLIDAIGEWVFREAAQWALTWSTQCLRPIQVSVNKSAMQFLTQRPQASWPQQLHAWHIPCTQVSVEITEGVLLKDSKAVLETLAEYRAAGIEIALDDFGTGYSSMAYLKKFRIDYLKIDQSFIRDIDTDQSRAIIEAIIVMGHKLGLKIIAEGIETVQQRRTLVTAGCDFGQGYLFSPALPPEDFSALLHRAS